MTDERPDQSGAENEGRAEWHVLGEHKLQRIRAGRQLMERWDIDIDKSWWVPDQRKLFVAKRSDLLRRLYRRHDAARAFYPSQSSARILYD